MGGIVPVSELMKAAMERGWVENSRLDFIVEVGRVIFMNFFGVVVM